MRPRAGRFETKYSYAKALELQLPEATEQVRLFHISVPQEAIDDLRARLRSYAISQPTASQGLVSGGSPRSCKIADRVLGISL